MANTIQNNLEQVLAERLSLIQCIQESFKRRAGELPVRFRRGPIQKAICNEVGIPWIGSNKRIINEALEGLGYIQIRVQGTRFYRHRNAYGR